MSFNEKEKILNLFVVKQILGKAGKIIFDYLCKMSEIRKVEIVKN